MKFEEKSSDSKLRSELVRRVAQSHTLSLSLSSFCEDSVSLSSYVRKKKREGAILFFFTFTTLGILTLFQVGVFSEHSFYFFYFFFLCVLGFIFFGFQIRILFALQFLGGMNFMPSISFEHLHIVVVFGGSV